MQPDEVCSILRAYKENRSRAAYLETEAERLEKAIWAENQPEMQAIHAQSYEFAPSSSTYASPTEKRALWAMDGGKTEAAKRWEQELRELQQAQMNVVRVDCWLDGLTEKERKVITAHMIDGMTWPVVAMHSPSMMGYHMSPDGLRRIGKKALDKIYRIAR